MTTQETITEAAREARIAARSDVVVVGGGPAGFAAAVAARREGCSVTLVERYPYLGGLASGGMVLVLDDMHNGDEVTVTGICMEMIERMAKLGLCVYPPPEERKQSHELHRKWARWGAFDFRAHTQARADRHGGGLRSGRLEARLQRDGGRGRCRREAAFLVLANDHATTAACAASSARPRLGARPSSATS